MQAVTIQPDASGQPQLVLADLPVPDPAPREVRVRVRAAGMNRADLSLKLGHSPLMAGTGSGPVAGLEMAGEVEAVGRDVVRWRVGDRVMGMAVGAHAQAVCLDERLLMPVPDGMAWNHAATLPVALMTAHDALVTNGGFRSGTTVLVQAASAAVGIAAVQLAALLGAGTVIGTSTTPDKRRRLQELGLAHAVDSDPATLPAVVRDLTGGRGVDIVLDHLGGGAITSNMACAAIGGRIVGIGRMTGMKGEIDLDLLSYKRLAFVGVTFRTRSCDEVQALIARLQADVWPLLDRIRMPLDRVYPLAEVAQAHEWMRAKQQFGKVVLVP
jgi:NADPH:quinone reductase